MDPNFVRGRIPRPTFEVARFDGADRKNGEVTPHHTADHVLVQFEEVAKGATHMYDDS